MTHFLLKRNPLSCQIFCLANFHDGLGKILILMRDPIIGRIEAITAKSKFRRHGEHGLGRLFRSKALQDNLTLRPAALDQGMRPLQVLGADAAKMLTDGCADDAGAVIL